MYKHLHADSDLWGVHIHKKVIGRLLVGIKKEHWRVSIRTLGAFVHACILTDFLVACGLGLQLVA
jgi:hypothetical protein